MKACDRGRTWEAAALIKSKKSSQGRKEGRPEKFPPTDPGSQEYSSTCSSCKQMLFVMLHLQPFFPPGRGLPLPVTGGPNLLATAKSVDPSKEQSGIWVKPFQVLGRQAMHLKLKQPCSQLSLKCPRVAETTCPIKHLWKAARGNRGDLYIFEVWEHLTPTFIPSSVSALTWCWMENPRGKARADIPTFPNDTIPVQHVSTAWHSQGLLEELGFSGEDKRPGRVLVQRSGDPNEACSPGGSLHCDICRGHSTKHACQSIRAYLRECSHLSIWISDYTILYLPVCNGMTWDVHWTISSCHRSGSEVYNHPCKMQPQAIGNTIFHVSLEILLSKRRHWDHQLPKNFALTWPGSVTSYNIYPTLGRLCPLHHETRAFPNLWEATVWWCQAFAELKITCYPNAAVQATSLKFGSEPQKKCFGDLWMIFLLEMNVSGAHNSSDSAASPSLLLLFEQM